MAFDPRFVEWRVAVCDKMGVPISLIDQYALDKSFRFLLNRPNEFSCRVPSDQPLVNILHTDGRPYLAPGRTIKAWRWEGGTDPWTLRYCGIVWQTEDDADEDRSYTNVTCFDPLQHWLRRLVSLSGQIYDVTVPDHQIIFGPDAAANVVHSIFTEASAYWTVGPGSWNRDGWLDLSSGTYDAGTTSITVGYDKEYVMHAVTDICDTGIVDLRLDWQDTTDAHLAILNVVGRRGSDKPNVLLAYDTGNGGAQKFNRTLNMDDVANAIQNFTGDGKNMSFWTDNASQTAFGPMESATQFPDINNFAFVDSLTQQELLARRGAHEIVTVYPRPVLPPWPFIDYDVGDTIRTASSSATREAISGIQRVYGFKIDVEDDGPERVSEMYLSSNQE